jgi:hypothetical protein
VLRIAASDQVNAGRGAPPRPPRRLWAQPSSRATSSKSSSPS